LVLKKLWTGKCIIWSLNIPFEYSKLTVSWVSWKEDITLWTNTVCSIALLLGTEKHSWLDLHHSVTRLLEGFRERRPSQELCSNFLAFLKSGYQRGNERKIFWIEPLLKDLVYMGIRKASYIYIYHGQAIKRQVIWSEISIFPCVVCCLKANLADFIYTKNGTFWWFSIILFKNCGKHFHENYINFYYVMVGSKAMDVMEAARKRDFSSESGSLLFLLLHHQSFKFWWWLSRYFFSALAFSQGAKASSLQAYYTVAADKHKQLLCCPPFSQAIFQMRFICFKSQGKNSFLEDSFSQN